ncbi:hypothetical protein [Streptomyces ambofaciens]
MKTQEAFCVRWRTSAVLACLRLSRWTRSRNTYPPSPSALMRYGTAPVVASRFLVPRWSMSTSARSRRRSRVGTDEVICPSTTIGSATLPVPASTRSSRVWRLSSPGDCVSTACLPVPQPGL